MGNLPSIKSEMTPEAFKKLVNQINPDPIQQAGLLGVRPRTLKGYSNGELPIPLTVANLAKAITQGAVVA